MTNYPFRFEGPKIGDVVYWVNSLDILETKIVGIHDSYDFMERTYDDPPRETWAIFYDIEDFLPYTLTFGDDLFLTKEEAENYINECEN